MWGHVHAGCLALVALMAGPAAADVDLSKIVVRPNPRLGLAFPGSQTRHYPAIAHAGIGVARISASWSLIEPRPGVFDFSGIDRRVKALQDLGIQPFLTFESDANWGTDPDTQKVKNARPRDLRQWVQFVAAVVSRYDGDGRLDMPGLGFPVRYYQVANEWIGDRNRSGGWAGTTPELIAYVNAAHDSVKAEDPEALFVLGGIASFNSDIMLVQQEGQNIEVRQSWSETSETVMSRKEMQGTEIAGYIDRHVLPVLSDTRYDIASVHLYGPENRDIARLKMVQRLSGHLMLSSECGGPTLDYGGSYSPERHFHAVIHRNLNVLSTGAAFCLWFRLAESDGATFGNRRTALYTGSGDPKPGVFAYRLLARLVDSRADIRHEGDGSFTIRREDGRTIAVAWGPAASALQEGARSTGVDLLCLADASRGLLANDPSRCHPHAMTFSGSGLIALLRS